MEWSNALEDQTCAKCALLWECPVVKPGQLTNLTHSEERPGHCRCWRPIASMPRRVGVAQCRACVYYPGEDGAICPRLSYFVTLCSKRPFQAQVCGASYGCEFFEPTHDPLRVLEAENRALRAALEQAKADTRKALGVLEDALKEEANDEASAACNGR